MSRTVFTSDDWDYVMKTHPALRKKYQEMLDFNELNPILAEEIDNEILKTIKSWEQPIKSTSAIKK